MASMRTIQVSEDVYLDRIVAILRQALQQTICHVYLFGSRAVGQSRDASDYDIGVLAERSVSRQLGRARELLEASTIPFTVDLVDLTTVSASLRGLVQARGLLLWSNSANG